MKQIVAISGKGGTGKTSLIASFACITDGCLLCDCDVDAANLHILLQPDVEKEEEFHALELAVIDPDKCSRCGLCEEHCRFHAINDFRVDPIKCEGCGVCQLVCPQDAVSTRRKTVGKLFTSSTRMGPFVHGRLYPGASNSGKMVSRLRIMATEMAQEKKRELVLIDGSPGIGCPVIASISGTDLVLVVSEPTLSGIHDLSRVIDLAEHFKTQCAVVVNKADINSENRRAIGTLCEERGVMLLGSLPYDPVFTRSMVAGKTVLEFLRESGGNSGIAEAIHDIWDKATVLL